MEYEILDECEDALFDDSTNPSLRPGCDSPGAFWATEAGTDRDEKRKLQQALVIPEEEHQRG